MARRQRPLRPSRQLVVGLLPVACLPHALARRAFIRPRVVATLALSVRWLLQHAEVAPAVPRAHTASSDARPHYLQEGGGAHASSSASPRGSTAAPSAAATQPASAARTTRAAATMAAAATAATVAAAAGRLPTRRPRRAGHYVWRDEHGNPVAFKVHLCREPAIATSLRGTFRACGDAVLSALAAGRFSVEGHGTVSVVEFGQPDGKLRAAANRRAAALAGGTGAGRAGPSAISDDAAAGAGAGISAEADATAESGELDPHARTVWTFASVGKWLSSAAGQREFALSDVFPSIVAAFPAEEEEGDVHVSLFAHGTMVSPAWANGKHSLRQLWHGDIKPGHISRFLFDDGVFICSAHETVYAVGEDAGCMTFQANGVTTPQSTPIYWRRGDALVFSACASHRGEANMSGEHRVVQTMSFIRASVRRWDAEQYASTQLVREFNDVSTSLEVQLREQYGTVVDIPFNLTALAAQRAAELAAAGLPA